MTRVLHVLGGLGTGGTECLIMNWYRNIDRTRVQFDFLVRSKDNNFVSEINELGGNIYYTSEFPKHILKNYKETKQVIKMAKWDIIHVHGNAAIYMTALVLAKRYNVPCRIMHSHSVQAKKNIYQYLHYFNRRFLHKFANIRLACSSKAGQWMFDDAHYQVLKNGVVLDQYRYNPSNRMRIRRELNLDKNFVVGHVGRFTEVKNHIFLLEIFKEIKKVKPDSVLLLVGEGELMAEIQSTATEMNISESILWRRSPGCGSLSKFL